MSLEARFQLREKLGEGATSEVFAAYDKNLRRHVAIKLFKKLDRGGVSATLKERFLVDARAAAGMSHPNIVTIYDAGSFGEGIAIVMELIKDSLRKLLDRVPQLPLDTALAIGAQVADGLRCLHSSGIFHRDIKPSNILLGPGNLAKIGDFGLAHLPMSDLTGNGTIIGTPRYMSPEQIQGRALDARSDLFAMGATLYEMLAGSPAFAGRTHVDVLHATLHETPAALGGSRTIESVNRILQRLLAKNPHDRPASASAAADDLKGCLTLGDVEDVPRARAMTWLVVLPFRVLRPDSETDFLAFSLPDAIASSLAGLRSLGVRSTAGAARFVSGEIDFARIAAEAHVDLVMTGTLLRAGDAIRVTTQLVGAPGGDVLWSHAAHATLRDVFQLQDDLVQRIVSSLSLPLTAREQQLLKHDVPANPTAYEFYLRANQVQQQATLASLDAASLARDLYLQSVDADPLYAPTWANLGRCYRVLGKSRVDHADEQLKRAESCLQRALSLNPQLASVTRAYAQLESDTGRSKDALVRLLTAARINDRDPELWAGLVHACRYCGLLDASVAAHIRATQLDPAIATSVRHTYWLLGEHEHALTGSGKFYFEAMVLASIGQSEKAIAHLREMERMKRPELMQNFVASLRLLLEGRRDESLAAAEYCIENFPDPEAVYYMARQLVKLDERARALDVLNGVLDRGFLLSAALARDPWLTPLHGEPGYDELLERSRRLEADVALTFAQMGGPDLVR